MTASISLGDMGLFSRLPALDLILVSVVMSPFSYLILLIWILSVFPLVSLSKGLPMLLFSQRTSFWAC